MMTNATTPVRIRSVFCLASAAFVAAASISSASVEALTSNGTRLTMTESPRASS